VEAAQGQDFDDFRRRLGDDAVREAVSNAQPAAKPAARPKISATPYRCRDPKEMPLRPWVYGRQLLRGSLSLVVAPGATGKTALLVGTALALATGRALLDKTVWEGPKRVWLWNLEDSLDELARLIEAGRIHWRIPAAEIEDRLFVDSALDGADLKLAVAVALFWNNKGHERQVWRPTRRCSGKMRRGHRRSAAGGTDDPRFTTLQI
jgi:hypothetical protein